MKIILKKKRITLPEKWNMVYGIIIVFYSFFFIIIIIFGVFVLNNYPVNY